MRRKNINYLQAILSIFLIVFSYYFTKCVSSCVTGTIAYNETQCNLLNTYDEYCCYLSPIDQLGDSFCLKMDKNIFKGMNRINYNQSTYSIYCGYGANNELFNKPEETDKICFRINPETYQECYLNSTDTNSCCYYNYKGMSGCYWLGTNYIGRTTNNQISLICSVEFHKFSFYSKFYFVFIFLFFF